MGTRSTMAKTIRGSASLNSASSRWSTSALADEPPHVILVGAGVRFDPAECRLFERLLDTPHETAPNARIRCNTSPTDAVDTIERRLSQARLTGAHQPLNRSAGAPVAELKHAADSKSVLITHEPQPVLEGDKAWAGFGRWPMSGAGSWPRDYNAY